MKRELEKMEIAALTGVNPRGMGVYIPSLLKEGGWPVQIYPPFFEGKLMLN